MDKISVVVPVYNVEKYLRKCIDSIINQTYKNLEIILVDDGSPDKCGEICDEYAKKDDRIKVIHKKNAGVSSARNDGIDNATGEYIIFVDSDDWLEDNAIEIMVDKLNEYDYDCVFCNFYMNTKKDKKVRDFLDENYKNDDIYNNIFKIINLPNFNSPWSKLFKAKIIKENNLYFPKDIPICEDGIFFISYIENIKSIVFVSEPVYNYSVTNASSAMVKYHRDYYKYIKIFTDTLKKVLMSNSVYSTSENDWQKFVSVNIDMLLSHYLFKSPNLKDTAKNIQNVISEFKEEINHFFISGSLTKKEIKVLKENRNFLFVLLWRKRNFVRLYKHKLKLKLYKIQCYNENAK